MNDKYVTVFVSTSKHDRIMRRLMKDLKRCKSSLFVFSIFSGIGLAMLMEQKHRINELEERLNKNETAG